MIRTRPPSKEYDAGWDAIFGPKRDTEAEESTVPEVPKGNNPAEEPEREEELPDHVRLPTILAYQAEIFVGRVTDRNQPE